jgi:hypothetical protein
MFHSAEGRVAALWRDLCKTGLFSADENVLGANDLLRKHCLNVAYHGPFAFGFACYWLFPTLYPYHLRTLFGPDMEPPGSEDPKLRLNRLLRKWQAEAIISFNGKVFKALTNENVAGYTKRLRRGTVEGKYPPSGGKYRIFQTYPTGWRYRKGAPELRQASLCRIAVTILGSSSQR